MRPSRYSTSRQKACQQCSNAKAKCDRQPGCCSRCTRRSLQCTYPQEQGRPKSPARDSNAVSGVWPLSPFSASAASFPSSEGTSVPVNPNEHPDVGMTEAVIASQPANDARAAQTNVQSMTRTRIRQSGVLTNPSRVSGGQEALDFSDLDLVCPINVDDISSRWLHPYIPVQGQVRKDYSPSISAFIYRILKSYAAVAAHGRGVLPFIHTAQITAAPTGSPLTTCLNLVRICSSPLPGSEANAAGVLQREMHSVYQQRDDYSDEALLAAFQAYLIYAMVLFFRLGETCNGTFRETMMNLQELACSSSRQGLVCAADERRVRPRWEEWIITEAKRRTLYVMYLFDSVLSTQEGLPTFLGTELRGLPASANKLLWQAQTRNTWEMEYNVHMAEWTDLGLTIDELWPFPKGLGESAIARIRSRVDHWLENIDEFGTMLYAIMSCTHGG